jgi:putative flavoprotein involved in K+ transport
VVGSGASGAQIAEELVRAGRRVYLSVGRHKRMARRYRGRDIIRWLEVMKLDQTPTAKRGPDSILPLITGAYGGHTIDFRNFVAQGMTLVGRLKSANGGVLRFSTDVRESLEFGDAAYFAFLKLVDDFVEREGLAVPAEPEAHAMGPLPSAATTSPAELDVRATGIASIVWSTGYSVDFSWIDLPVLGVQGEPLHRDGISQVAGLYFLGLPWLSKMSSSFLSGVADDAARLSAHIAARRQRTQPQG